MTTTEFQIRRGDGAAKATLDVGRASPSVIGIALVKRRIHDSVVARRALDELRRLAKVLENAPEGRAERRGFAAMMTLRSHCARWGSPQSAVIS